MDDIIGTISGAVAIVKQLLPLIPQSKGNEAQLLISDLQLNLAQVKTTLADLINENRELKSQIKALTSSKKSVTIKDGLYYAENGNGPYCTACFDTKDKLVLLTELSGHWTAFGKYKCNSCQAKYGPATM